MQSIHDVNNRHNTNSRTKIFHNKKYKNNIYTNSKSQITHKKIYNNIDLNSRNSGMYNNENNYYEKEMNDTFVKLRNECSNSLYFLEEKIQYLIQQMHIIQKKTEKYRYNS